MLIHTDNDINYNHETKKAEKNRRDRLLQLDDRFRSDHSHSFQNAG